MKIALTIPSFARHGGIRVIMEWANRLELRGHEVFLYYPKYTRHPDWFRLSPTISVFKSSAGLEEMDRLIICSPHDIDLMYGKHQARKTSLFLQMLEHLFQPQSIVWKRTCNRMYSSDLPMFCISQWNADYIREKFPNRGPIYMVGNGVNLEDFPLDPYRKDGKTILVEGWNASNPSKDVDSLGPNVAAELKLRGYTVLAYGTAPPRILSGVPSEYIVNPTTSQMNDLYRRATILVKATKYDARSCSPMEAMTKGTVTARAIIQGDDDLADGYNCLRVGYNEEDLYQAAVRLLEDGELRSRLAWNCLQYVQDYSWDYWMDQIERRLA